MKLLSALSFMVGPLLLSGCIPLNGFQEEIRRSGHIVFQNPLAKAGTGTLLAGSPKRLTLIAPPQTCFPEAIDGVPTRLRFVDNTTLPTRTRVMSVGFEANVELLKMSPTQDGTISAGVDFDHVEKMELSFEGVHVEYLDSIRLTEFYREQLGPLCKDWLDRVGFISQAIQAEKMAFRFYGKSGGEIHINVDNLKSYVDLSADIKFEIIDEVQLVITTPAYLGYQLGKLQRQDDGMAFYRASRALGDKFIFEKITTFPSPNGMGTFDANSADFQPL